MRCPHCSEKVAIHDLWCIKCGKHTDLVSKDLSAVKSFKESWERYKTVRGRNMPVGIIAALTGFIPMYLIIWLMNYVLVDLPKWQHMLLSNVVWLVFLPVLLVPFQAVCRKDTY